MKKAALTQTALQEKFHDKILWDMPGLFQMGYLHQIMPYEKYKTILPEKVLRPTIYQLNATQAIIIDGLIAINYIKGEKQSFVFYFNQIIKYHKTNVLKVPILFDKKEIKFNHYADSYETKIFKLDKEIKYQVTFADMGILHLLGPATIEVVHAKNMHVTLMEAMFK
ncbi:GTP-binding protein, putative fragment [Alteracholeplasma palmae J233]|uniref:GTP-binding protein, putative n=2 Tax=Acholeplasma palmae TaxID=38986 RepID=U4KKT6_ALTPJ|nr:GTP-binding protein, putative fragment [Alteracholeplasma palmae J233]